MPDKVLALYIRLSTEDGDLRTNADKHESNSVGNQRKLLNAYLASCKEFQQYQIVEFCDDGYSGTNFNRPGFLRMMELVRLGQIQCIMVKDLSRFGREFLEVGAYLEIILPLFGTRFISVNDSFDSNDYIGTTGGMELALRNLINGIYSKDLSIKVRSAIQARNRRGQYWGGQPFYGYLLHPDDKHKLVIDDEVRANIVLIFTLCIQGKSTMEIAKYLNEKGIPSPAKYKKQKGMRYNGRTIQGIDETIWLGGTVRKILNDERYTGKMVSGTRKAEGVRSNKMQSIPKEQWIIVENTHEGIITPEQFSLAQEALNSRIRAVNKNTAGNRAHNLFVCGYCGRKLQKSNGKDIHMYCIKTRSEHSPECEMVYEKLYDLQNRVVKILQVYCSTLLNQAEIRKKHDDSECSRIQSKIRNAKQRIESISGNKISLYEEYKAGRYTEDAFRKIQQDNATEVIRLQNEIVMLGKKLDLLKKKNASQTEVEASAKGVQLLSEYRPEIICRLVDQIRVFADGDIELIMKSGDSFHPVEMSSQAKNERAV